MNMRWEMIVVNEWDVILEQCKAGCISNYSPIDQCQYLDHRFNVTSDLRRFRSAMSISCLGFVRTFYNYIKDHRSFYVYIPSSRPDLAVAGLKDYVTCPSFCYFCSLAVSCNTWWLLRPYGISQVIFQVVVKSLKIALF